MKKLAALFLIVVFAFPIFSQFQHVSAQMSPVTGPITTPITFFNLTGDVTLKKLGRLLSGMQRVIPAEGVMVKVSKFFNPSEKYETMTDEDGNYQFNLPAGLYKVEVDDEDGTFFVPPLKVVNVRANREREADFQGLLFP